MHPFGPRTHDRDDCGCSVCRYDAIHVDDTAEWHIMLHRCGHYFLVNTTAEGLDEFTTVEAARQAATDGGVWWQDPLETAWPCPELRPLALARRITL